jgi:2-polyprenyl-6-methoxyphenol hydroxylase-like FAD-dependent oxidoreductase
MTNLNVGVVGGGTAGAAAALFLSRAGHRVTVYERVPDPGPVGAGIVLQPTGAWVLSRLGVLTEVASVAAPLERLHCVTPRGKTIIDLNYRILGEGLFGMGTHRGAIFQALDRALGRSTVVSRTGVEIVDVRQAADGSRLVDAGGLEHGPYDLVVVADGARSQLRRLVPGSRTVEYPWGALWFLAKDPERRFTGTLHQVVRGTKTLYGLLPTGVGPSGSTPWVSFFWSLRADRVDGWRAGDLEAWKRDLVQLTPASAPLVAQIERGDQLLFSHYYDARLPVFHAGNVVFLGDAAHAMSPQLGQGCNMALMDAAVLADCLAQVGSDGGSPGGPVAQALAAYTSARVRHVRYYQFVTRWLTPFFQSDHSGLGWLRDHGMAWMRHVPWFQRLMTLGMAGVQRGIVRRPLPLGPLREALATVQRAELPEGRAASAG